MLSIFCKFVGLDACCDISMNGINIWYFCKQSVALNVMMFSEIYTIRKSLGDHPHSTLRNKRQNRINVEGNSQKTWVGNTTQGPRILVLSLSLNPSTAKLSMRLTTPAYSSLRMVTVVLPGPSYDPCFWWTSFGVFRDLTCLRLKFCITDVFVIILLLTPLESNF